MRYFIVVLINMSKYVPGLGVTRVFINSKNYPSLDYIEKSLDTNGKDFCVINIIEVSKDDYLSAGGVIDA